MMNRYLLSLLLLLAASSAHAQFAWRAITIPVRDGASLAADLYTNNDAVARPVVLIQTPYNKNAYRFTGQLPPGSNAAIPLDTARFDYVIVDWRGFYGSTAAAKAGYDRGLEGYDVVEWIAAQPWCNGRIGTWGASALGQIQFMTARQKPPHLVCAVPLVKDFKTKYGDYFYGGEFRRAHVETLERLGFLTVDAVLQHPTNDSFWKILERASDYPEDVAVPMLVIGGWFDHFPDDVLRAFDDLQKRSDPSVRSQHRLIFGPWTHGGTSQSRQGELDYANAATTAVDESLRFLKHHLLGEANGWSETPRVRYYQLGAEEWRSTDSWSGLVAESDTFSYYLQASNFSLTTVLDSEPIFSSGSILYDPHDPSPTVGGSLFAPFTPGAAEGPYDQRSRVESRGDALVYTSAPLEEDLEVAGPVSALLLVRSDREDTDIGVRLTDVYPDGRSMLMTQGIRRLRFRDGFEPRDTALGIPGNAYPVTVELQNLAITFRTGHSIRIIITSSNYPHFDLNPNSAAGLYQPTDTLVANNTIISHPGAVSSLRLPLRKTTSHASALPPSGDKATLGSITGESGALRIRVSVPNTEHLTLELYDLLGHHMATLHDGLMNAGDHELIWDGATRGTWMVRLRSRKGSVATSLGVVR
jgi:predicted acyl esterase